MRKRTHTTKPWANNYAELAGAAAQRSTRDYHVDNPYVPESNNWHAWRRGWRLAREQQMERVD